MPFVPSSFLLSSNALVTNVPMHLRSFFRTDLQWPSFWVVLLAPPWRDQFEHLARQLECSTLMQAVELMMLV